MREFLCDLHVHSLLSPCAEIEMTPHHIVLRAAEYGIGGVVVTDHNASANYPALEAAAKHYGVAVLPGMEVESAEEAHIVTIFDTREQIARYQEFVDEQRPHINNRPEKLGGQFVVDADDNFLYEEEKMLLGAGRLPAQALISYCRQLGGLAIAAHVDKPSYSLLTALGFLGPELELDAAELSRNGLSELTAHKLVRRTGGLPYTTDSDAHMIVDFIEGPKNLVRVESFTVAELRLALAGEEGRRLVPGQFVRG